MCGKLTEKVTIMGSSRKILEVPGANVACVPDLPERLKGRVLLCTGIQQPTVPPG